MEDLEAARNLGQSDDGVWACPECINEMYMLIDRGGNDDLFKCPECGIEQYDSNLLQAWDQLRRAALDDHYKWEAHND